MLIDRMACACPGDRLFLLASNWWRRWTTTTPSPTAAPWTGLRLLCQEKCWSRFVTGPRVFVISIFLTWLNSSGCDAQTLVGTIFGYAYDFMTPFPRCVPTVTVAKAGKVQDHSAWADLQTGTSESWWYFYWFQFQMHFIDSFLVQHEQVYPSTQKPRLSVVSKVIIRLFNWPYCGKLDF